MVCSVKLGIQECDTNCSHTLTEVKEKIRAKGLDNLAGFVEVNI